MTLLGIILLILGLVLNISILTWLGIVLIVLGVILFIAGSMGSGIGGRRHYW